MKFPTKMSAPMSFEDALNFRPMMKQHKKPGKHGKLTKPGKPRLKSIKGKGKPKGKPKAKGKAKGKGRGRALSPLPFEASEPGTSQGPGAPKTKKKEDMMFDLEQQFLLRMPPGPAIALRRDVESGAMNLKDKLFIEIQPDMRHCRVTYGGQVMNAKLMDVPAVVQCMKTTDMKNFYVTADIAQMMVCVSDDEDNKEEAETGKKKDKDHKWKWNHGITPSLKNVRKRRFRKTIGKQYQEQPDIEKEVRRLFRMDAEAIDVKWEVVIEDNANNDAPASEKQVLAQGTLEGTQDDVSKASLLDIGEEDIFGEMSSSEDDDDDEKDVNIVDSDEERAAGISDNSMQPGDYSQMGDSTNMSDGSDVNLQAKLQELERVIEDMRDRKQKLEMDMETCDSYLQKERLQSELATLEQEEQLKEQEYHILAAMYQ